MSAISGFDRQWEARPRCDFPQGSGVSVKRTGANCFQHAISAKLGTHIGDVNGDRSFSNRSIHGLDRVSHLHRYLDHCPSNDCAYVLYSWTVHCYCTMAACVSYLVHANYETPMLAELAHDQGTWSRKYNAIDLVVVLLVKSPGNLIFPHSHYSLHLPSLLMPSHPG